MGTAKAYFEASNRAGIYTNLLVLFSVGSWMVSRGLVAPTTLISFIGYCWTLNFAMQGILYSLGDLKTVTGSLDKIFRFLREQKAEAEMRPPLSPVDVQHSQVVSTGPHVPLTPPVTTASTAIAPATVTTSSAIDGSDVSGADMITTPFEGVAPAATERGMEVELRGVHFSYPNREDVAVLRGVNLRVPKGKLTALVGSSGAGKSTIANLLNAYYSPTAGSVMVDGEDVTSMGRDDYLRRVSVVRQAPLLFTDTVANNIAYGAIAYRAVSEEEVVEAAKAANAHDFIMSLPEGYQTMVGQGRGMVQLSGGQKQRLAIARAIIKDADLLVLDESTSALDSESEALVQQSLSKLMLNRTTVVIAHRLSTVKQAHQICVVRDGTIVEVGRHDELMLRRGYYYSLIQAQVK